MKRQITDNHSNNGIVFFEANENVDTYKFFFGAYDAALLYAANMYIDERPSEDRNGDNQVSISPVTWHNHDNNGSTNTTINDAVAYSCGGQDTPEEYQRKLYEQIQCMNDIGYYYPYLRDYIYQNHGYDIYYHNETKAPLGVWENYFRGETFINELYLCFDYDLSVLDDVLDGNRPYAAGYSSWPTCGWSNCPDQPRHYAGRSAGVDCVGLIMRSAGYDWNPYTLRDLGPLEWSWYDGYGYGGAYANNSGVDYRGQFYSTSGTYFTVIASSSNPSDLYKVMPGDVVFISGHVMMVDKIEYNGNTRTPNDFDIHLIESWWGIFHNRLYAQVMNVRTLYDISGWTIKRMHRDF